MLGHICRDRNIWPMIVICVEVYFCFFHFLSDPNKEIRNYWNQQIFEREPFGTGAIRKITVASWNFQFWPTDKNIHFGKGGLPFTCWLITAQKRSSSGGRSFSKTLLFSNGWGWTQKRIDGLKMLDFWTFFLKYSCRVVSFLHNFATLPSCLIKSFDSKLKGPRCFPILTFFISCL